MPLDELPPELADEVELAAMDALRGGVSPLTVSRLKRDLTVLLRRYNALAEVRVQARDGGVAALLILPDRRNRVKRIQLQFEAL